MHGAVGNSFAVCETLKILKEGKQMGNCTVTKKREKNGLSAQSSGYQQAFCGRNNSFINI